VQSVAVFIASHFAFCSSQKSQCFTVVKGMSLVAVMVGVVLYSSFNISSPSFPSFVGVAAEYEQLSIEDERDNQNKNKVLADNRISNGIELSYQQSFSNPGSDKITI
jgi:hypothetical protein